MDLIRVTVRGRSRSIVCVLPAKITAVLLYVLQYTYMYAAKALSAIDQMRESASQYSRDFWLIGP
jgi:hypothetical protein